MTAVTDQDLLKVNRRFYDPLWTDAHLVEPDRFNTWPLVGSLVSPSRPRLEIAPGLRPRLPIDGTHFVDISMPAIAKLRARGASAVMGLVSKLPFPDRAFDPVCALDIVEHVDDDDGALSEISRVAMPGAALLLSVPLHPSYWTPFDDMVGHRRRYEPELLVAKLSQHGLVVGGVVNSALITLGPSLIPPPAGADMSTAEGLAKAMHLLEPRHFIMPLFAHALGTFAGSLAAYLIAATCKARFAYAIGAVFLCGGVAASFMIPAPAWFIALDLVAAYLPTAWLGMRIGARMQPGKSTEG